MRESSREPGQRAVTQPSNIDDSVAAVIEQARCAHRRWRGVALDGRLKIIRQTRHIIAARAREIGNLLVNPGRPLASESLPVEVLPLADACRFLERESAALLAPMRLGRRGRPAWLFGVDAEIRREPLGVIAILAPSNYPLFIPGVQILQALAAGNAVIVKPAIGASAPMHMFARILAEAGLPDGVLQITEDSVSVGEALVRNGGDKVILTGSAQTGRAVLSALSNRLVPATMELSGSDAVFVLAGADIGLVADALAYGLRLNGGATCIAPRRVFIPSDMHDELEQALARRLAGLPAVPVPAPVASRMTPLLREAEQAGCRFVPASPDPDCRTMAPLAVVGATEALGLLREDLFAPVLAVVAVADETAALAAAAACPYALGAAVFGPGSAARDMAARIDAGSVTVNDLIVTTADPRLPFGGRGESGFGVTRGAAGLLEMTGIKTVSVRSGRFRPHYDPPGAGDEELFAAYIEAAHARGLRHRAMAFLRVLRLLSNRERTSGS